MVAPSLVVGLKSGKLHFSCSCRSSWFIGDRLFSAFCGNTTFFGPILLRAQWRDSSIFLPAPISCYMWQKRSSFFFLLCNADAYISLCCISTFLFLGKMRFTSIIPRTHIKLLLLNIWKMDNIRINSLLSNNIIVIFMTIYVLLYCFTQCKTMYIVLLKKYHKCV